MYSCINRDYFADMKKKIAVLLIILVLFLSFTACDWWNITTSTINTHMTVQAGITATYGAEQLKIQLTAIATNER